MSSAGSSSKGGVIATVGSRILRSRRLVRAPIWIYRCRLGGLLGSRLLMLEHIGRKSGVPRHVVLEVIDHPRPDAYVVASGFGVEAEWFRNIQANPAVRVYLGSRAPVPGRARVLDQRDADRTLAAYIGRSPRAWNTFRPVVEETLGTKITATNTPLPLVELRVDHGPR